jgi:hypothetical protein
MGLTSCCSGSSLKRSFTVFVVTKYVFFFCFFKWKLFFNFILILNFIFVLWINPVNSDLFCLLFIKLLWSHDPRIVFNRLSWFYSDCFLYILFNWFCFFNFIIQYWISLELNYFDFFLRIYWSHNQDKKF